MGWKYDEDNKEWVTTEEYNERELSKILLVVAVVALIIAPILPARIVKWVLGYEFLPELGLWQYLGDLLISVPIYAGIAVAVYVVRERGKTE